MRLLKPMVSLLLVVLAGACRPTATEVALDRPFELTVGGTVRVTETDLIVRFLRVDEDSRCPRGVQCIQAGQAVATFAASVQKRAPEELRVRLRGGGADTTNATGYRGYRLRLVALEPEPVAGVRTDSTAYVATVVVRRSE